MNIYEEYRKVNDIHPDKLAMSKRFSDGRLISYTYEEMTEKVDKYADALVNAGLTEGDRIAFVSEGCPEWTVAFLAVAKINCTSVLIDASLSGGELISCIEFSDVRAVFASENGFKKIFCGNGFPFPVFNIFTGKTFDGSLTEVSKDLPETPDKDPSVATIIFSSGTTRKAAGIMHYHDTLINTTRMTLTAQKLRAEDRYLAIIPNSHIYGVICLVLGPILSGADIRYIDGLSADAILGAFGEYHPTVFPAVPKVYELFMTQVMKKINSKAFTKAMFKVFFPICLKRRYKTGSLLGKKIFKSIHDGFGGSLEFLCSAGAPLKKEVAEFFYGTGFNIIITYGASETNIPTIGNKPERLTTDTCGTPYPDIQVRISDSGELLVKSPYIMKGYFRNEEATREAFDADGWFMTGDLAKVDADGFYSITGRSKENIVFASGKKATPEDIEEKYSGVEGVKDFVISGVPAENADYDEVHAFIVPENDNASVKNQIKESFRKIGSALPSYMKITGYHFVDGIEKTSLQKPKRYLLKSLAINERKFGVKKQPAKTDAVNDVLGRVIEIISEISGAGTEEITESTRVFESLNIDSLSSINLAIQLEDCFGVDIEPYYSDGMTVSDIVSAVNGTAQAKNTSAKDDTSYPIEKNSHDYYRYRFFRNLANIVYRIRIYGYEGLPRDKGYIICANHVSKIDMLYIAFNFSKDRYKRFCCMAKKELFRNDPFSKMLIKSTGMVPVDRSGMNMKTMDSLKAKLSEGWCVVIHPEGTRSEDGIFRTMKNGASVLAQATGAPIVPAYIDGSYEILPKNKKMISFFDWKHLKKHRVNVLFGDIIESKNKTADELTQAVQSSILELQDKAKNM